MVVQAVQAAMPSAARAPARQATSTPMLVIQQEVELVVISTMEPVQAATEVMVHLKQLPVKPVQLVKLRMPIRPAMAVLAAMVENLVLQAEMVEMPLQLLLPRVLAVTQCMPMQLPLLGVEAQTNTVRLRARVAPPWPRRQHPARPGLLILWHVLVH